MKELADVDLLLRFNPRSGKSAAFARDLEEIERKADPIFLPMSQIEVHDTGRFDGAYPIVTVTMPQWLAEQKELV